MTLKHNKKDNFSSRQSSALYVNHEKTMCAYLHTYVLTYTQKWDMFLKQDYFQGKVIFEYNF